MCVKKCLVAGVAAALVAFVWASLSWMVLPWHMAQFQHFKDNKQVAQVLTDNTNGSGLYVFPCKVMDPKNGIDKPFVFVSLHAPGASMSDMPMSMAMELGIQMLSFVIIAFLLSATTLLCPKKQLGFVVLASLAGSMFCLMDSIWWHMPWAYTGLMLFDQIVGAILGGFVLVLLFNRLTPKAT